MRNSVLCALALLLCFNSRSQDFGKSEINELNQLSIDLIQENIDSALQVANNAKLESLKISYSFGTAKACYIIGYIDETNGKLDKAAINYFECLRYLESENLNKSEVYYKISSLMNIGRIFQYHHQLEQAIDYHHQALEFAHLYKRTKLISWINYDLAITYKANKEYLESINALFESSKYAESIDDYNRLVQVNQQLGLVFKEIGKFEESRDHYFKIFNYQDVADNFSSYAGKACHNIANTYLLEHEFSKTEEYYLKSIAYKAKANSPNSMFITYMDLGELYLNQNYLVKAEKSYINALSIESDISTDPNKFKIYKQLSTLYGHLGNPEKFTEYNTKYTECLEKHLKTSEELAQMDQQYNIQLVTQRYFELVESQKRMAALKKYGGFAVAAILSIILLYLIIARVRKTRLKKSLEQELKEAMQGLDFDL